MHPISRMCACCENILWTDTHQVNHIPSDLIKSEGSSYLMCALSACPLIVKCIIRAVLGAFMNPQVLYHAMFICRDQGWCCIAEAHVLGQNSCLHVCM